VKSTVKMAAPARASRKPAKTAKSAAPSDAATPETKPVAAKRAARKKAAPAA
jgi:hypothetical protein